MELRERRREDDQAGGNGPVGGGGGGNLDETRRAGEEFLAAGDAAINKALSGNSEQFLAAHRQQGGQ